MEPLLLLVTLISVVFAVINYWLRNQEHSRIQMLEQKVPALEKAKTEAEEEFRKRKDTLEARTAELTEAREKLRDSKKKLHEEKGVNRKDEIERARAEAEREAQSAIEAARRDAAEARDEARRAKAELDAARARPTRRPESSEAKPAAPAAAASTEPAAPAVPAEPRAPRPLTEPEQNRMALLERQAIKQSERVKQLEEDSRRQTRRADANDKVYKVARAETDAARAKSTSLERRLNRTLLELDQMRAVAFKAGLGEEMARAVQAADAISDAKEKAENGASPVEATPPPAAAPAPSPEAKA